MSYAIISDKNRLVAILSIDPKIATEWSGPEGYTIHLVDNFQPRPDLEYDDYIWVDGELIIDPDRDIDDLVAPAFDF